MPPIVSANPQSYYASEYPDSEANSLCFSPLILSAKQIKKKYQFLTFFVMTRPGIEPWPSTPRADTLSLDHRNAGSNMGYQMSITVYICDSNQTSVQHLNHCANVHYRLIKFKHHHICVHS